MLPFQVILHPTDLSPCSEAAFQLACSLARDHNARLIVLYVLTPPPVLFDEFGNTSFEINKRRHKEEETVMTDRLHQIKPADSTIQIEHRIEEGDPAELIVSVAEWEKSGLIVMGTHGRTGLTRLLMGSVAETVMRQVPCPVALVKAS